MIDPAVVAGAPVLEQIKEFWFPIVTGVGGALLAWFTALANMKQTADKIAVDQVAIMLKGWEQRALDLQNEVIQLRAEVKFLRQALDNRPECEDCVNRARMEYQIATLQRELNAIHQRDISHVQRMGD